LFVEYFSSNAELSSHSLLVGSFTKRLIVQP
jgi:hypothetical protein